MTQRIILLMAGSMQILAACMPTNQPQVPFDEKTVEAVQRSLDTVNPEEHLGLFDYDRSLPLELQEQARWDQGGTTWVDFSYASPLGGQVPARMILPKGSGPFPGILMMHGSNGDIELFSNAAYDYAKLGTVVMLIESPHIRPGVREFTGYMGDTWPYFTERDRQDQIQLMVDLRRAIDILQDEPLVDEDRLAYIGYSYGGAMGGLLAGIENRLKAYVLVVGDGGLVEHTSEPKPNGMPYQFNNHWVEAMWPIEPIHYVGRAAPAALLYQNGRLDELVPRSDALRYQVAGSDPKTIIWYDSGHNLGPGAFQDSAYWLQDYLGESLLWMAPDYHPSARWVDAFFTVWIFGLLVSGITLFLRVRRQATFNLLGSLVWVVSGLLLGPIAVGLHHLVERGRVESKLSSPDRTWTDDLTGVAFASVVYLIGALAGNLISIQLLGGDFVVLTYLVALVLGWIIFGVARQQRVLRPLGWLLAVNMLWALNVLLSYPLMRFWRLSILLHPRLLWYTASLMLINTAVLLILFQLFRRLGLMRMPLANGERPTDTQPKISWPAKLGLVVATYTIDSIAILQLMASLTGMTAIELIRNLRLVLS